ncbi:MAG TPA: DUF4325 domain-containing protein [Baekduia sp.]|uniref:STAS-like domain-containing protein n=1 Tax=Baekduia sp. TaxID=2600305 RepID=UPI002BEDC2CD|nr:DUF4325 domain-containing protein [Baekduia sp.]HMJ34951.1 DUF4325 domain-containing protein [Baekduia sp.]
MLVFDDEEDGMAVRFSLNEFSRTFATRERAAELRELLIDRVADDRRVVVDFTDVTNVSYSFADEFLGKLSADGDIRVAWENLAPSVAQTVERAVDRRAGSASGC